MTFIYAIYANRHFFLLLSEHSLIKAEVNDISLQNVPKTVSLKPRRHKYILKLYAVSWSLSGFNVTITEWLLYLLLSFLSLYSAYSLQAVSTVIINKYHVVSIVLSCIIFK